MRTECCLKIPNVEVRDGKELNGSMLTSSVLCQQEDRVYSLAYVLIHEYRIENSFYACSVGKDPHGSCPPPYLPKSPFDGVGCPYCLAEIRISELEAGEQIIKIIL